MMSTKFLIQRCLFVIAFVVTTSAQAKDMTERLGIGFKNNTSRDLPSLGTVYHMTRDLAVTGGLGINTEKNYSAYQIHAGLRKILFYENNLNFFTGVQAGLVSYDNPVDGRASGVEILATFGSEFYFAGLENLGFTFEAGVGVASAYNTQFRTIGDSPFRAGMMFYF